MNPNLQTPPELDWRFLKRTLIASIVAAVMVGWGLWLTAGWEVGARYTLSAVWAAFFLSMSGAIFYCFMVANRKGPGMLAVAAKFGSLILIYLAMQVWWPLEQGPGQRPELLALVAGLSTPFIVLVLRVISRIAFVVQNGSAGSATPRAKKSAESRGEHQFAAHSPTEGVESHS